MATPNTGQGELASSQSAPEEQINDNAWIVDVFGFGAVKSATLTTPPASPLDGDLYIRPTGATGAWASIATNWLVAWNTAENAWLGRAPWVGLVKRVNDVGAFRVWNGTQWTTWAASGISAVSDDPAPALGGDLEGAGRRVRNVRLNVTHFSSGTRTFDGFAGYVFTATGSSTFTLPAASGRGAQFQLYCNSTGTVIFVPESGASLIAPDIGNSTISSCRTTGQRRIAILEVEDNATGSNALWIARGSIAL